MDAFDEERVQSAIDAIRQYLDAHPDAADSLSGIQQWWLPDCRPGVGTNELAVALDRMVREGEVRCARLADRSQVYSRARTRRDS